MGRYTESMMALQGLCIGLGVQLRYSFIYNESLITRARNQLASTFLNGDSTHLMFIDGDIGFNAADVVTMLGLMDDESDYDVMAGIYPTKTIAWDRVRQAARDDKADISRMGNRFVVKLPPGTDRLTINEPARASSVGTGFMMIRRRTFDLLRQADPARSYVSDDAYAPGQDPSAANRIHLFFQADIDPQTQLYLSEDYYFCQTVLNAGASIWICPWMVLDHVGSYTFSGSLSDLAR